ncbi:MAG: hypothetical protein R3A46_08435 [Thermomicrobiales bacterium]
MSMQSLQEIQLNMNVYTSDAVEIGRIKKIRDHDILIDRPHARDIYVPFTFISQVLDAEQRVELSITEQEFNDHVWDNPPIM